MARALDASGTAVKRSRNGNRSKMPGPFRAPNKPDHIPPSLWPPICFALRLLQARKQHAGFRKVGGLQPLAEPAVDRHEDVPRLLSSAACRVESSSRDARPKLGQLRSLGNGGFYSSLELRVRLIFSLLPGRKQQ